jgi:hypothetical protein
MDKILVLLGKLKKASDTYLRQTDNEKRIRIYQACEFLFKELEELKIPRAFSEAYLCYGDEFINSSITGDTVAWCENK